MIIAFWKIFKWKIWFHVYICISINVNIIKSLIYSVIHSNSAVFFIYSFYPQKHFTSDLTIGGCSWFHWLQLQTSPCEFSPISYMTFSTNSMAPVIIVACTKCFPSTQLSFNMLVFSSLWTDSLFSNDHLWLTGQFSLLYHDSVGCNIAVT